MKQNYWLLDKTPTIGPSPFEDWIYDYPRPPFERWPEPPSRDREINLPLSQIFTSERSPAESEFAALRVCYVNYRNAEKQFQQDKKRWDEYMVGFERWFAANRWRYVQSVPADQNAEADASDE